MFDFEPPANLEWIDYSNNNISRIENAHLHAYLRFLKLDENNINVIEGLQENRNLRVLSLNSNTIDIIENLDGLLLDELYLADNNLKSISGLQALPNLRTLDLTKNGISKLSGFEIVESLRFLYLCQNNISKVRELNAISELPLITELDLSFNPVQARKYYRLQVLFIIPQLRSLDGSTISAEEKIKAENLHGLDLNDRKQIFQQLLPEEQFVDRRIQTNNEIDPESESEPENIEFIEQYEDNSKVMSRAELSSAASKGSTRQIAGMDIGSRVSSNRNLRSHGSTEQIASASVTNFSKKYVGELFDRAIEKGVTEI